MTPEEERQHLTQQLADYGLDVLREWMRIVELEDVAGIQFQARMRWQDDGTAIMGETQYSEEYGRFRFTVNVEDLGHLPPIGPENDLGVYGITDERAGEPVSAGQGEDLERMGREIAEAPKHAGADGNCPDYGSTLDPCPPGCASGACVYGASRTEEPQWVLRTWADVVTGDEVRMPGTEVTAIIAMRYRHPSEDPSGRSWHVVPSTDRGPWAHKTDHFVQPGECVVRFGDLNWEVGEPRFMKPAAPVEIMLSPTLVEILDREGWESRIKQAF